MKMTNVDRLIEIREIILRVDDRAAAVDGPVTPTLEEMTQDEMSKIYKLAGGLAGGKGATLLDDTVIEARRIALECLTPDTFLALGMDWQTTPKFISGKATTTDALSFAILWVARELGFNKDGNRFQRGRIS